MNGLDPMTAVKILLVEDNPGDVRLAREGLREGKILNQLWDVPDGEKALAFLRREGEYRDAPRPDLILMDLNLPRMRGDEVLQEIKEDPELRSIPVVVLTMSKAEQDIIQAYNHHANCYITKPIDLDRFIEVVQGISNFWFSIVQLPPDRDHGV